ASARPALRNKSAARSAAGEPATAHLTYAKDDYDDRNREVVQQPKRLWLHPAGGRLQGCVRAHLGGRARRDGQFERRAEGQLRTGARPARQDLGRQPATGLTQATGEPDQAPPIRRGGFTAAESYRWFLDEDTSSRRSSLPA